ncbi:MAG: HlyD family efflux transporter periplasmic adaptor subunit [Limnohabitans sp.]|nr:HlyD family efflux transporter periplasmic adaptor subunit [Limnohabitans sp.]
MDKLKEFFKKIYDNHFKKSIAIILIIIFAIFFFNQKSDQVELGKLDNGNLEEIVNVSGVVETYQESFLAFEKTGKVKSINVKIGDKVKKGKTLASLSDEIDYVNILNAEAGVKIAEANLLNSKNGASLLDLKSKEQMVQSAENAILLAYQSIPDTIRNTYTTLTDILGNKIGNIFTYTSFYKININSCDQNLQNKTEIDRGNLDISIKKLSTLYETFSQNIDVNKIDNIAINKNIDTIAEEVYNITISVSNLLTDLDKLINANCLTTASNLTTLKENISKSRNSIDTTINNINSLKSEILNLRNTLTNAQISLEQLKNGDRPEKILALQGELDRAKANLISQQVNNQKNYIQAPFDGIISQIEINLGEITASNIGVIRMISEDNLSLKVKLSESDLIKINKNNTADIYLDIFGESKSFKGIIQNIDPASNNKEKTSTYYANIDFAEKDEKIKIGLNGYAKITTNKKENVNYILSSYLKIESDKALVAVLKDENNISEKNVI